MDSECVSHRCGSVQHPIAIKFVTLKWKRFLTDDCLSIYRFLIQKIEIRI